MKLPDWLPRIGARDEIQRAAHGLTAKRDGWYKSIGGKTRYVCKPCPVPDAIAALGRKLREIETGDRYARIPPGAFTVDQLIERFLLSMYGRVTTGHPKPMKRRTYDDYIATLDEFSASVGGERFANELGPDDFSGYAKTFADKAASTRRRKIIYVDRLLNWAGPGQKGMNFIPVIRRGPDWIKPSDDDLRKDAADTDKSYSPEQIAAAFKAVTGNPFLNAAAHLGLNCAFGPKDIGTLPDALVDVDGAMIRFPRGKTGVARLCPMVPETVAALRAWLEYRARLNSCHAFAVGLFFRTREGRPYAREYHRADPMDAARHESLLTAQWSEKVGLPYSGLRSTFATLADDWPDERAVDMVMGHKVGKRGGHVRSKSYAKKFNPDRVVRLVAAVWPLAFGRATPT